MSKILALGYFGLRTNQLDGQTIKTRDLYKLACHEFDNVHYYDTEDFKFNKFSLFEMFWKVITCRTIIYLPAHNNLKIIFPIIFVLSKIFRTKIHYFVVGGWLREFLANLPLHRFMLRHISGIHTETQLLKSELETYYNFTNVDVFPNFRFFDFQPSRTLGDKLRVVFMARVNKMKGLDWIFSLAEYIKSHRLEDKITLTFYGPIHEEDRDYFEAELRKYSFAEYKGVLQPSEIHQTLNDYDVMLLPTHYYTEGLPGSIIDAYISGIPVIVTDWKHSREFVDDGKCGFVIPFEDGEDALIDCVIRLMNNRDTLLELQNGALSKRKAFMPPAIDFILK